VRIIDCSTPESIPAAAQQAVAVLRGGGVVVYPTETVYGLGADAANPSAVDRLLRIKDRPAGKAISVLVADAEAADRYVTRNPQAKGLYTRFLPGPMTVVSAVRSESDLDARLYSENGRLGIRISSHETAAELAKLHGGAITATSANPAGAARPYDVPGLLAHFSDTQRAMIDLVLDAGVLPHAEPSSVIDTEEQVQTVVRAGGAFADLGACQLTQSEADTVAIGEAWMRQHLHVLRDRPLFLVMQGDMGAGKTHLTKGIAAGLAVKDTVTSPSYTLVKEYVGMAPLRRLLHIDCWRTPQVSLQDLGITANDLLPGLVVCIEWPDPVMAELQVLAEAGRIVLRHARIEVVGPDERKVWLA
jgi:L-threonylcarbamoyladenylate synthase